MNYNLYKLVLLNSKMKKYNTKVQIEIVSDSSDDEIEYELNNVLDNKNNLYINNTNITQTDEIIENNIKTRITEKKTLQKERKKREKKPVIALDKYYSEDENIIEIGTDESGYGPMFGRVYTASVVLPKDDSFNHNLMKDSKKFTSKKKIEEAEKYIKENALAWSITYMDEKVIDEINILQANQKAMHKGIKEILLKDLENIDKYLLLVDGCNFKPLTIPLLNGFISIPYECIKGGDNKYTSIAAASILAKTARDRYIKELCEKNPILKEYYSIDSNMGYGAKKHIDGIKEHGITQWHRKSFGICKNY
jgi:ribonuclease HII